MAATMKMPLSARGRPPRGVWHTQRESRPGGDTLKMAAAGLMMTPREEGPLSARNYKKSDAILPPPQTPDSISRLQLKHRKKTGPGEMTTHWGMKEVPKPDPGEGFGVKGNKMEGVRQIFQSGQLVGVAEYKNSVSEAIYQSTTREPLGKGWNRGHSMPACTLDKDFPGFGNPTVRQEGAEYAVHPRDLPVETDEIRAMYRKTHGEFHPGEQIKRDYQYPPAIASNPGFRFGYLGEGEADKFSRGIGAKTALTMEQDTETGGVPKTVMVSVAQEAFQKVAHDHLGRSRSLMQNANPLGENRFGIKTTAEDVTAGKLISGFYPPAERMPDYDLGKCTVPGRRNFATDRAFGVPSVRQDLILAGRVPSIDKRSVANTTNYGDDMDAFGLLFPNRGGPVEEEFHARRPKAEVRELVSSAGLSLEPDEFDEVFDFAASLHGDGGDTASVEAFKQAFAEWSTM